MEYVIASGLRKPLKGIQETILSNTTIAETVTPFKLIYLENIYKCLSHHWPFRFKIHTFVTFLCKCQNMFTFLCKCQNMLREVYSELSRISKMELLAKIVNDGKLSTIFAKSFILGVRLGSEYARGLHKENKSIAKLHEKKLDPGFLRLEIFYDSLRSNGWKKLRDHIQISLRTLSEFERIN